MTMEVAEQPPASVRTRFQPGQPKRGGRRPGTPNRDRALTIKRIMELVDPIEGLARIAMGQPMMLAPAPGEDPALVYPTLADVRAALTTLAGKVMPDLKSVSLGDTGNLVTVMLNLAPSTPVKVVGEQSR